MESITVEEPQNTSSLSKFASFFASTQKDDSQSEEEVVNLDVMTLKNPSINKHRFISACIWELVLGMGDGVVGGILPSIEEYYNVNYTIVSLIWMGNALGFITIAFVGHHIDERLGLQRMPVLSTFLMIIGFSIIASGVKVYPLIVFSFYLNGVAAAIGVAPINIFLTKLENSSKYLGFLHGCYGIGGFIAPLIGTLLTSNQGYETWHYFYMVPLGLYTFNIVYIALAFNGADKDLEKWYNEDDENEQIGKKLTAHDFISALKNTRTWLSSSFIFFYQGTEVAMGGWVVTFLLDYRKSNRDSTGYVSSGFWGGVALGRFILTHPLKKYFGIRRSIIILAMVLMVFDILVWLVPNVIAAGTFASIMGFLIGPIYPLMIKIITQIMPRKVRFCGLLIATAFGSSGGSLIPFIIGLSSEYVGTFILHPIFLGCYFLMGLSWILMPNIERTGAIKNIWQKLW